MTPRSVRNSNPGNLRIGQPWQGLMPREQMTPEQKAETEFCVFIDPEHGFRSLAKLLHNYQTINGLSTVRKIISKYAPNNENNTEKYIAAVKVGMGIASADSDIDLSRRLPLFLLCQSIAAREADAPFHEFWTNDQLADGLDLAGF